LKSQQRVVRVGRGGRGCATFIVIAPERTAVLILNFITSHHTHIYHIFSLYSFVNESRIQLSYSKVSLKEAAIFFVISLIDLLVISFLKEIENIMTFLSAVCCSLWTLLNCNHSENVAIAVQQILSFYKFSELCAKATVNSCSQFRNNSLSIIRKYSLILTCVLVIIDEIWIGNWIC
jgi:hypothetical protein